MSKTVTVTEKFDERGNLVERVTETTEDPDDPIAPATWCGCSGSLRGSGGFIQPIMN